MKRPSQKRSNSNFKTHRMLKNEKHALLKVGKVKTRIANAILIATTAAVVLTSCSKNQDTTAPVLSVPGKLGATPGSTFGPIVGPSGTSGEIRFVNNVYEVKEFNQTYTTAPGQPANGNLYWNFYNNEGGDPTDYDLHFTGIASGDITVDQTVGSNDSLKYVSGTTFAAVTLASWATATTPSNVAPSRSDLIGMDDTVGAPPVVDALSTGYGWYIYTWAGHTVTPVANRVLLFKDGSTGDIFKFQISSVYNGSGQFPFYSFNYQQL